MDRLVRLQSMGIDNEASTMLRELRPLVAQHIDGILDKAFEWILSV